MRILMMHGIGDPDHPEGAFLRQMEYLKANFRVVPLDSILGKLAGDDGRPDGEVALSFDDGLRSHLTVVYPILARLRLPATFFICPGLVEEGRWQWNHECTERLRSLAPQALDGLLRELALGGTPTGGKLVAWAIERIKALPAARRASAVAAIEGRTPRFRPSASQHAAHDVLTWEELRSLPAGLIGVGSHGWTHEVLAGIGAERLDLEIRESRQRIEQRLGRPVECFCYPNGIVPR
jgi:peptidoglycan/xylan/chitin deacetylase (PgdA/CDA1 family)